MKTLATTAIFLIASTATGDDVAAEGRPHAEVEEQTQTEDAATSKRWISAAITAGVYTGVATWSYFAWYKGQPDLPFKFGGDGYFGRNTYAGGADKVGHAWSTYTLGRATSGILRYGGWNRNGASVVGNSLALLWFTSVELKDGFHFTFSPGDQIGNVLGAGLGMVMDVFPVVDEMFDFRMQYLPSRQFRKNVAGGGGLDVANDYTGQQAFVAFHLSSVPQLKDTWLRFVDVGVGFRTRNYKPDVTQRPRQELYLGIALNSEQLSDALLAHRKSKLARKTNRVLNSITEFMPIPYTTLPVVKFERSTADAPSEDR